ncbi:hypothetical protein CF54_00205 [Streptomyces sp. Tu 6176]|uniref:hypothetical protein n=1 Tax=Streptomyces sp. Tu 6176 TaxID=1470557 RepID=UPI00044718ED|nr:hypothetical protein [Streptomyces sp. Tu 6176]EYT84664.1 hypothetical protein CF54_00205 [Streptomyces sp. Tu 6176]
MLRKAYVSGAAALFAALLLAGCSGGSSDGGRADNANPDGPGPATAAAQPGRYRTLPEACRAVGHGTLDTLLPGIQQLTDPEQREKAYDGEATLTYDTDRKVGCRWKVDSAEATDHLHIDFERVVSYDNAVSDDSQAEAVFATRQSAADLPAPLTPSGGSQSPSGSSASQSASRSPSPSGGTPGGAPSSHSTGGPSAPSAPSSTASAPVTDPAEIQPRTLDDLGDEAFLDDALSSSGSTVKQRTVTVVFRTSNVIVTIEYEEQPAGVGAVPDSKEMQDRARNLAAQLADSLGG